MTSPRPHRSHLLVVTADSERQEALSATLGRAGYDVTVASALDAAAAGFAALDCRPSAVVVDNHGSEGACDLTAFDGVPTVVVSAGHSLDPLYMADLALTRNLDPEDSARSVLSAVDKLLHPSGAPAS